jgi:hypothetical protein
MYRYLITNDIKVTQEIWRVKLPLKIKIFLWFLKKGVILTKDNLAKRNWQGSKYCCFCSNFETIQHLFFECNYAKFLWHTLHMVFGITPPCTVENLFGNWYKRCGKDPSLLLLAGAAAFCCSLWLTRNDSVFDKCSPKTFLQVLFRGTYWFRFWGQLQRSEEKKECIYRACQTL